MFGLVFIGPVMHKWFALLEKVLSASTLPWPFWLLRCGSSFFSGYHQVVPVGKAAPLVKVGLDQAIIGPLVCFSFFSVMGLMVCTVPCPEAHA